MMQNAWVKISTDFFRIRDIFFSSKKNYGDLA